MADKSESQPQGGSGGGGGPQPQGGGNRPAGGGGGGGGGRPQQQGGGGGRPGGPRAQAPILRWVLFALSAFTTIITLYVLLQGRIALGSCSIMVPGCVQTVWVSLVVLILLGVALQVLFEQLAQLRDSLWRTFGDWFDLSTIVIATIWIILVSGVSPEFNAVFTFIKQQQIGVAVVVWTLVVIGITAILHGAAKIAGSR